MNKQGKQLLSILALTLAITISLILLVLANHNYTSFTANVSNGTSWQAGGATVPINFTVILDGSNESVNITQVVRKT